MMMTPSIDLGLGVGLEAVTENAVPTMEGGIVAVPAFDTDVLRTFSDALATPIRENVVIQAAFEAATKAFADSIAPVVQRDTKPPEVVSAEKPVVTAPVVVEKPVVTTPVVVEKPEVIASAEKPVVAARTVVEKPDAVVVPAEKPVVTKTPVVVEKPEVIASSEKPVVVARTVVEKPDAVVVPAEKPVVTTTPVVIEKPEVIAPVEKLVVAAQTVVETPDAGIVPAEKPMVTTPVVIEKPEVIAPAEKPPVVAARTMVETPDAVTVPAEKLVVTTSVVIEKPKKVEVAVASKEAPPPDDPDQLSTAATPIAIDAALDPARRAAVQPVAGPDTAVTGVDAVSARTVEVAERVAKVTSEMDVLVQAADAVVDTMLVSPGLMRGEGEVRVILKPEVLGGSELRIAVAGRQMEVEFIVPVADIANLVERCRPQLEQQLVAKIHAFDIGVKVYGPTGRVSRRRNEEFS